MNAFQRCTNTSDAVPLYLPQQLYLKPIARINITVQLTQKLLGKTITHHELMERLRDLIRPDEFTSLKVTKTTLEIIRFEAEVELKKHLQRVVGKLDGKMIKLKEFSELMKVRAAEAKLDFPRRHDWDVYFRDAKDMNEMKPGERPDTVHISNLPTKWFVPRRLAAEENLLPYEKIFYNTFEKFGKIRNVDIPICDPYRKKMKAHITGIQTSSLDETEYFEGYIQYKDYIGFSKCMEAISCKKLLRKEDGDAVSINIYVDFDKTKHLSEASLRRREIVRDRLVLKQKDLEAKEKETRDEKQKKELEERQKEIDERKDKEKRRREREEKRKAKIMAELKVKGSDDITDKIAREEKKLLKVQRRLEAIRLVEELFKRIKTKLDKDPVVKKYKSNDELSKMKALTEFEVETRRDKLHKAIEGRVILKSIIAHQSKDDNTSSSSESPLISENEEKVYPNTDMAWYNYLQNTLPAYNHLHSFYNQQRFPYYIPPRGRLIPGPSGRRPYNNRGRSRAMNHYLNQEYYKHAQNGVYRNYKRSYTKSRSRSRSYSRHRSRSYSRERSRRRTRSPSRRRTKSLSRRRSKSRRSTRTRSRSRRRSRSRSRSKTKSP